MQLISTASLPISLLPFVERFSPIVGRDFRKGHRDCKRFFDHDLSENGRIEIEINAICNENPVCARSRFIYRNQHIKSPLRDETSLRRAQWTASAVARRFGGRRWSRRESNSSCKGLIFNKLEIIIFATHRIANRLQNSHFPCQI